MVGGNKADHARASISLRIKAEMCDGKMTKVTMCNQSKCFSQSRFRDGERNSDEAAPRPKCAMGR